MSANTSPALLLWIMFLWRSRGASCTASLAKTGTVIFNGETIEKTTPIQALRRGLSIIYQEFNLVNKMTVGENIFLGRFGETKGMKGTHQRARALLDSIGSTIDTHTIVGEDDLGESEKH